MYHYENGQKVHDEEMQNGHPAHMMMAPMHHNPVMEGYSWSKKEGGLPVWAWVVIGVVVLALIVLSLVWWSRSKDSNPQPSFSFY